MFQSIPVYEENIVAFKIAGTLSQVDQKKLLVELTSLIDKNGPLSVLFDLEDYHGLESRVPWYEFNYVDQWEKKIKRIAIVGDKKWEHMMATLNNVITKNEIRYFKQQDFQEAWDWLRESDINKPIKKTIEREEITKIKTYKHILVATDFSPHAELAFQRACQLTKLYDANLTVLHTVDYMMPYLASFDPFIPDDYLGLDQSFLDDAEKRMNKLEEELNLPKTKIQILSGIAKPTILLYAEAQQVDLIVMGTHGKHGFDRLIGSTTNGVINRARCDVLAVKMMPGD